MISREMRQNTTIWFEKKRKKRKRNEKRRKTLDDPLIISVRKTKWLRLCS